MLKEYVVTERLGTLALAKSSATTYERAFWRNALAFTLEQ